MAAEQEIRLPPVLKSLGRYLTSDCRVSLQRQSRHETQNLLTFAPFNSPPLLLVLLRLLLLLLPPFHTDCTTPHFSRTH